MTVDSLIAASSQPRFWGLIPCAGTGSRAMTAEAPTPHLPKQYQLIAGQPLVLHTLAAFSRVQRLSGTLVAVARGDEFLAQHASPHWFTAPCGGPTRADTVMGGLHVLLQHGAAMQDWVLVHDAARCLITPLQINGLIDRCQHDDVGGLLAHPLPDTLKAAIIDPQGCPRADTTIDRSDKWLAQTPQMFRMGALKQALEHVGAKATDEASAMQVLGHHPVLVPGGAHNFKVTYPEDFALADAILNSRTQH